MRIAAFLSLLLLTIGIAVAQRSFFNPPQNSGPTANAPQDQRTPGGDSTRMWRRAQIRVVPLEQVANQRNELASLRSRVAQTERERERMNPSDAAVREQLAKQAQLIRDLLSYSERQDSDQGKSPTALEVQSHLNRIEGQVMCEACHSGLVAGVRGSTPQK